MFKPKILMRETCLGFSNIEEFYQSCNFGCFWWISKNIKPTCCTYQNLCMTFTNILGFLLNFSTSWKSCVKEQWPKKSLFYIFDLTSGFVTRGKKKVGIYLGPWNHDRWPSQQRTHKLPNSRFEPNQNHLLKNLEGSIFG